MKFIKLHQDGQPLLVNLCNVSDIIVFSDNNSRLNFNSEECGDQVSIPVDESIDEILELIRKVNSYV